MSQGRSSFWIAPSHRTPLRKAIALMLLLTQFAPPRCFCGIAEPHGPLVRVG